jgi:hypothetical protein
VDVRQYDEQVRVEYDGIERGIIDDLVRLGIPHDKIVLTFLPAEAETRVPA